jgi:hypothetical protein
MSPLGVELLSLFWPGISAALFGGAAYFWRQQAARLDGISKALDQFRGDVDRIERDFAEHRIAVTHKLDRVIGMTHARLVGIETVCEQQHGVTFRRRHTDVGNNWAHDSDILGGNNKSSEQ